MPDYEEKIPLTSKSEQVGEIAPPTEPFKKPFQQPSPRHKSEPTDPYARLGD